ncbi:MAG: hypothetical protein M1819_004621 [Sarea resinae]|nr:MAG: hypothetical protein M1819_004621 [Sarea resinae]
MTLKKGHTFHSPSSPADGFDPILDIPSLPRRSPTCPKALEDILARERHMAAIIGSIDRSIEGVPSSSASERRSLEEELPVPRILLDATMSDPDSMDIDSNPNRKPSGFVRGKYDRQAHTEGDTRHHTSDSGLGSSITGTSEADDEFNIGDHYQHSSTYASAQAGIRIGEAGRFIPTCPSQSAISRSLSSLIPSDNSHERCLSQYATEQIGKHIIDPILLLANLKEFHPLIEDVPRLIKERQITCLRDLEKTVLFLAPVWAASKWSYLHFCETSIQCIHTTVNYLNERDQRRPTDRPYTNGYFLDLVEQIRQYASMVTAARERQAAGHSSNEMDYSPDETVTLQGGLSQNGRPAQLVRVKEGKTIPLGGSQPMEQGGSSSSNFSSESNLNSTQTMKRPFSDQFSDDDGVRRSMARRKKSSQLASPESPKVCGVCDKKFKRPCDLTKHAKTHSRPWKCTQSDCEYYHKGWPTEKERDRHVNDKHSAKPDMFKCHYTGCSYQSKRESNCKQHMEKSHGWNYIRSKSSKKAPKVEIAKSAMEAESPASSHVENATTPTTSATYSPFEPMDGDASIFEGAIDPALVSADVCDAPSWLENLDVPDNNRYVRTPPMGSALTDSSTASTSFETLLTPNDVDLNFPSAQWPIATQNQPFTNFNPQFPTPSQSAGTESFDTFPHDPLMPSHDTYLSNEHNLSINLQGNPMLYSPISANGYGGDECMEEPSEDYTRPSADFDLYPSGFSSGLDGTSNDSMFQDLSTFTSNQWILENTNAPPFNFNDDMVYEE